MKILELQQMGAPLAGVKGVDIESHRVRAELKKNNILYSIDFNLSGFPPFMFVDAQYIDDSGHWQSDAETEFLADWKNSRKKYTKENILNIINERFNENYTDIKIINKWD